MSFRLSQYVGSGYPETRSTTMVPTEFFLVLLEVYKIGRVLELPIHGIVSQQLL